MSPTRYSFGFNDLMLTPETIEKFIGYPRGSTPQPVQKIIESTLNLAADKCRIQGGYVIIKNPKIDRKSGRIWLNKVEFEPKQIITGQLRKSDALALFICTAGPDLGKYSRELMANGDLLEGYIADAVGSEIVESAISKIQEDLESKLQSQGIRITDRYSPGYCGWSVSEQHKLFSFFPLNFCGVSVNEYGLMEPIKSVSGVIGIGKAVSRKGYACNFCKMPNCIYRKLEYHEQVST